MRKVFRKERLRSMLADKKGERGKGGRPPGELLGGNLTLFLEGSGRALCP